MFTAIGVVVCILVPLWTLILTIIVFCLMGQVDTITEDNQRMRGQIEGWKKYVTDKIIAKGDK